MKIELKQKFDCKKIIKELDCLVKCAVSLFDDFSSCRINSIRNSKKLQKLETILLIHFLEKTNFESVFDNMKASYIYTDIVGHNIFHHLLCNLGKKQMEPTLSNLLLVCEESFKQIRRKRPKKYSYYLPTRIELELSKGKKSYLKKILKNKIGIEISRPSKKLLESMHRPNLKELFDTRQTILKLEVRARDYAYVNKILDRKVLALIGALAFTISYQNNPLIGFHAPNKSEILTTPLEDYIVIVEDDETVVYPASSIHSVLRRVVDKDIRSVGKSFWIIHDRETGNYKFFKKILNLLANQTPKIRSITESKLKLYLDAVTEKQLEISFLKFWVIIESTIKLKNKKRGAVVVSSLKKLLAEKELEPLIDSLYAKRNLLVHEFEADYISQQDRSLVKIFVDKIMLFLIDQPIKLRNPQELKMWIDNAFFSDEELIKRKDIITKLLKKRLSSKNG